MRFRPRALAWAVSAAILLLLPGVLAAAPAPKEDVLSSEPGRPLPGPGQDVLTTLPPASSNPETPAPAPPPLSEGPAPSIHLSGTGIEVLNGSGFGGHAAYWARRLKERGLTVARVANAERLDHPRTLIYYAEGAENVAIEVRRILGRRGKLQPRKGKGRNPVVVVLGRDLPRSDAAKPRTR